VDRLALREPSNKLTSLAVLCLITLLVFLVAFAGSHTGPA
jgi:hypothetical protein